MLIPASVALKTAFHVSVGTNVTKNITAPTPPTTLTRNSMVCIPKMLERPFDAGTFWSLQINWRKNVA